MKKNDGIPNQNIAENASESDVISKTTTNPASIALESSEVTVQPPTTDPPTPPSSKQNLAHDSGTSAQSRTLHASVNKGQNKNNNGWRKPVVKTKAPSKPTFHEFPVIITDTRESQHCQLSKLGWQFTSAIENAIGKVRAINPLGGIETKTLVGCSSKTQQQKLEKLTTLGGVKITCSIPYPSVLGVVKGIPVWVPDSEVLEKINFVQSHNGELCDAKVTQVTRLTNRFGSFTRALKVKFECHTLPAEMQINRTMYKVEPFVPRVTQCKRCQNFGHSARYCLTTTSLSSTSCPSSQTDL